MKITKKWIKIPIKPFLKIEKTEENAQASFSVDNNHKIFSLHSLENKKLNF